MKYLDQPRCRRWMPRSEWAVGVLLTIVVPLVGATTWISVERLPALVQESTRAVLATVESVEYRYDERRMPSTFVRLIVEDRLYGEALPAVGEPLEIKIYGAPEPMPDGLQMRIDGAPRYRPGQRYLLLLRSDSPWGFTNPPGLFFGVFRIEGSAGQFRAQSLGGNDQVFGPEGLAAYLEPGSLTPAVRARLREPGAAVPYALLKRAVQRLKARSRQR